MTGPLPHGRGSERSVNQPLPGWTENPVILRERPFLPTRTYGSPLFSPADCRSTRPAITALPVLAVLNVGFNYARIIQGIGAERQVPCTDGLLTHFASPFGGKRPLRACAIRGFDVATNGSRTRHATNGSPTPHARDGCPGTPNGWRGMLIIRTMR